MRERRWDLSCCVLGSQCCEGFLCESLRDFSSVLPLDLVVGVFGVALCVEVVVSVLRMRAEWSRGVVCLFLNFRRGLRICLLTVFLVSFLVRVSAGLGLVVRPKYRIKDFRV